MIYISSTKLHCWGRPPLIFANELVLSIFLGVPHNENVDQNVPCSIKHLMSDPRGTNIAVSYSLSEGNSS